jgi:hypothetical protein
MANSQSAPHRDSGSCGPFYIEILTHFKVARQNLHEGKNDISTEVTFFELAQELAN